MNNKKLSLLGIASFLKRASGKIYAKSYCLYVSAFPYAIEEEGFQLLSFDLILTIYRHVSHPRIRHKIVKQLFHKADKENAPFERFYFIWSKVPHNSRYKKFALEKMVETAKTKSEWLEILQKTPLMWNCGDILLKAQEKVYLFNRLELQEMVTQAKSKTDWEKTRDRANELPNCEDLCSIAMFNISKAMKLQG